MSQASVEQLVLAETRLTRSFVGFVVALLGVLLWSFFLTPSSPEPTVPPLVLMVAQFALYVWYAISAGAAAKLLGGSRWLYVSWILLAPFLARIPIPLVSTLIAVSPLSIKFLLGGQLQTAIRQESFAELHSDV